MDSNEVNKLLAGLLGTVFVVFSVGLVSDALFASPAPEKPGFIIEATEPAEGGPAARAGLRRGDLILGFNRLLLRPCPTLGLVGFGCQLNQFIEDFIRIPFEKFQRDANLIA